MFIVKNLQEAPSGNIKCLLQKGDSWVDFLMSRTDEYEVHESTDWEGIRPCDQAEKDEHEAQEARNQFKLDRAEAMRSLTVTTQSGWVFDADETSQTRMSRAITIMNDVETTVWVLADNTPIQATKAELKEALRLAGEAQAALWVQS